MALLLAAALAGGCRGAAPPFPDPAAVVKGEILAVWDGDLNGDGRADRIVLSYPKWEELKRPWGIYIWLRSRNGFKYIHYWSGIGALLPSELSGTKRKPCPTVGPISLRDVNGNGYTDLCFRDWGGGNNQGGETILEVRGTKLWSIFHGYLSRLADLDGDGVPEIVGPLGMGWRSMCVLPTGVWKWRNGRYEIANAEFREYLQKEREDARARSEKYPDDIDPKAELMCGHLSLGDRAAAQKVADEIRVSIGRGHYEHWTALDRSMIETDIKSAFELADRYLGGEGRPPAHQEAKEFVGGDFEPQ